jgi:hypothetical protein
MNKNVKAVSLFTRFTVQYNDKIAKSRLIVYDTVHSSFIYCEDQSNEIQPNAAILDTAGQTIQFFLYVHLNWGVAGKKNSKPIGQHYQYSSL